MTSRLVALLAIAVCSTAQFVATASWAAEKVYVTIISARFGEIKGEGTSKHGSIEVQRFADDYAMPGAVGGAAGSAAGKVQRGPIVFTRQADKASPILLQIFATGEVLRSVVFTFIDEAAKDDMHYRIVLTDVQIVKLSRSFGVEGPQGSPLKETIGLIAQRVEEIRGNATGTFNFGKGTVK